MFDGLCQCDARLQTLVDESGRHHVDLGTGPRAGTRLRGNFDQRQRLANWAGVDLTRINGLGVSTA